MSYTRFHFLFPRLIPPLPIIAKKTCARALRCWTAWQNACDNRGTPTCDNKFPTDSKNDDFWDMLSEHESALEKSGGSDNYRECNTEAFAKFFWCCCFLLHNLLLHSYRREAQAITSISQRDNMRI